MYENLMKPITFRGMTVKNRIFLPPMKTNYIKSDHSMSEDIIQYYEDMAKGGIGLITTEAAEVDGEIIVNEDGEWECPQCHNKDHAKMNVTRRTCGYLGENFWNEGKTKEIAARVLHI